MITEGKLYYTIGEVAEMLDCNTSQVRYWSGEFNLNLRKNRKGDRLFQSKNLNKLKFIKKLLKEDGYTIDGAKKKVAKYTASDFSAGTMINTEVNDEINVTSMAHPEVVSKLKSIKENLEKLKVEIDRNL